MQRLIILMLVELVLNILALLGFDAENVIEVDPLRGLLI
jgi:hypothetical protein